jgi:sialic acid synthase SpsE
MVDAVRIAEKALGKISYDMTDKEKSSRVFRRSLFVVRDMEAGEKFDRDNVRSIRPGHGLPVRELGRVLGKLAKTDISRGTPLSESLIA